MSHGFTKEQISFIQSLMTQRNKSVRHEVSDHLDNALPVKKLSGESIAGPGVIEVVDGLTEINVNGSLQHHHDERYLGDSPWVTVQEAYSPLSGGDGPQHSTMIGPGFRGGMGHDGTYYISNTNGAYPPVGVYVDPAEFAAPAGYVTRWRIESVLAVNAVNCSALNVQSGIMPLAGYNGSGVSVRYAALPTLIYSYAWNVVGLSNYSLNVRRTNVFELTSVGWWAFMVTNHSTVPTDAAISVTTRLQYRHQRALA